MSRVYNDETTRKHHMICPYPTKKISVTSKNDRKLFKDYKTGQKCQKISVKANYKNVRKDLA